MNPPPDVTIIVPTYREAETLPHLVSAVAAVRAAAAGRYELLVMDDDSPDGTADVVRSLGCEHDWVRVHVRHADRGLAAAVVDGISLARGAIVVVMDADLSHPPQHLPALIAAVEQGADMAIGSRYVDGGTTDASWGWFRKFNSLAATWLARPLSDARDPMSGYFAFRRDRLTNAAPLNPIGYKIGLEILVKTACQNVVEIPIEFADRVHGESKLTMAEQWRYVRHVMRLAAFKMNHGPSGMATMFIVIGTLLRLFAAVLVGLGIDESYQVTCARQFHWSFFDHPPMSFWMASSAMAITGSDAPLVVRLPFVLMFVLTCVLMYALTRRLFGGRAAAWSVALFNLSPLYAVAAGSWVLPDGPMVAAVLASALCLTPLLGLSRPAHGMVAWRCWCLAGFWLGVALLSKYLAVLFAAGVLLYVVSTGQRRWLRRPQPYLAVLLAMVTILPVLVWNAQHGWGSFAFQAGRARPDDGLRWGQLFTMLGGQAIYLLPWIWWPLLVEAGKALRGGRAAPATWFCACLGGLPIVVMTVIPLWGSRGLPHWTAVGYVFLFPLLGYAVASQCDGPKRKLIRNWLKFTTIATPVIVLVLATHAATGWGVALLPTDWARHDPTLDTVSWKSLEDDLASLDAAPDAVLGAVRWYEGGKAGSGLGDRGPLVLFSRDPRHFQYATDPRSAVGRDVIFLGDPSRHLEELPTRFGEHFEAFGAVHRFQIRRAFGPAVEVDAIVGRRMTAPYDPSPPFMSEGNGGAADEGTQGSVDP